MPLRLRLACFRHRLLCWISPAYRDSSHWQSAYESEHALLLTARAQLAAAQSSLAAAQDQIKTLTFSVQNTTREASRLRRSRDRARVAEAKALRLLATKVDPIVDVLALRVLGQTVYHSLPEDATPPTIGPTVVRRGTPGRAVVREETRKVLEEIEREQDRLRNGANGIGEPPDVQSA